MKIWEDFYNYISKLPCGKIISVFIALGIISFLIWDSLPDSIKESTITKYAGVDKNIEINKKQANTRLVTSY